MNEASEQVKAMQTYIDRHFCDPELTVMKLEDLFCEGDAKISRSFKTQIGETPGRYITEKRMQKALALMQESSLTLDEISAACGYTEARVLNSAFKRKYGVAPRTYAEQLARNDG